jgi:hypothetical protein
LGTEFVVFLDELRKPGEFLNETLLGWLARPSHLVFAGFLSSAILERRKSDVTENVCN